MSVLCPRGHASETADFCDQCGGKINGVSLGMVVTSEGPRFNGASGTKSADESTDAAPPSLPNPCPNCRAVNAEDDRFCESCGYDFRAVVAPPAPVSALRMQVWETQVTADRAYYDRLEANGIPFPAVYPERRFTLSGDRLVIGRRSASRGTRPEIDLSGGPEDVAVSHMHAILISGAHGAWAILDPGSANGTFLNDSKDPVPTNEAIALREGDQIHIGAWTTLTLRATSGI
jgi:hypothetical protein